MKVFDILGLGRQRSDSGSAYLEFLRQRSMSLGLYEIPAGGVDGQAPHTEDEVYYILKGRAKFVEEGIDVEVEPGTVIFVEAGKDHRFHSIAEDLSVLVFFAPAEHTNQTTR